MPDLTTIDKIDSFKNQLNKDVFMWLKFCRNKKASYPLENTR